MSDLIRLDDVRDIPDMSITEEQVLAEIAAANGVRPRFRLEPITAAEIIALPDPPASDMLLGPFVVRRNRTIVVGDTGHGKTTFVMQMIGAIVTGSEMIHHQGAGVGPVMIIDLEQGIRSIKRTIRETGLQERQDVIYISVPDGLALDTDQEHFAELERVITEHQPVVVALDPYYKAHRGDANEERGVVDLMRTLDQLRAAHGFALIMPAHPRKDIAGAKGARKLTLHDVSGSGAIIRGAEVVLGIERLNHGYARLRYLKDRDGDLPVGDHIPLLYIKGEGFKPDPKEEAADEDLEQRIMGLGDQWRTAKEWAVELKVRETRAKQILDRMVDSETLTFAVGPPGRSPKAKCYSTAPALWAKSGAVTQSAAEASTAPTAPTSLIGEVESGRSTTTDPGAGSSDFADDDIPW